MQAQLRLLTYVATLPKPLQMLRLSSDLLPFYSHPKVAAVYQDPAIAQQLNKSEKTVRNQVSSIFDKLGVRTRAEAIVYVRDRAP